MIRLLSQNSDFGALSSIHKENRYWLNQAFATAGDHFQVFSQQTTDVLVPYGEGASLIAALCSQRARQDVSYCQSLLIQAKPYTVSLYDHQLRRLSENGGVQEYDLFRAVLPAFYDDSTGVTLEAGSSSFLEV